MISFVLARWETRSWHRLIRFADNQFAKATILMPLFGYLIIYNDNLIDQIKFTNLLGENATFFLQTRTKLIFSFFGLLGLSISFFWFQIRKPLVLEHASHPREYVNDAIQKYNSVDIINVFKSVKLYLKTYKQCTNYGNVSEDEYVSFLKAVYKVKWQETSSERIIEKAKSLAPIGFKSATEQHYDFVSRLLFEHFAQMTRVKKVEQYLILCLCIFSYFLLSISSLDLVATVVKSLL